MMRAYLDEAGLRFHGAPSETLRDAIDDLVDVLDDVREFDDEVVLWSDAAYDAEVDDDTTFMDFLFTTGDATLADARRRLMLAVNRLTSWETPDWELDVPDHDVHLAGEKVWAPSLAQAVTAESALGPIAVLALSTAREPGPTTVVLTDQAAILHTVTAPTGRRAFVRTWLQARPPAPVDFPCWLDRAFPDLRWTDEAQNGLRTNSKYFFGDRFPTTVHHLGVLNDHAADVFVEQTQNDLRQKHLSALDVNASPESPNTRANRKAVEQRQVEWQGQTIAFWWHTKIRYDTGRIHFHHDASAPAPGRIVIGLCVEHLLV